MSKINDILIQMRNKAEQAASDTLGSTERAAIQTQLSAYAAQIQDAIDNTKWNSVRLLDQSSGPKTFQTGPDQTDNVQWTLTDKLDPTSLKISSNNPSDTTTLVANVGTSFTGQASVAAFSGLSKLDTGGYAVEVLDKATATTGKVNVSGTLPSGVSGLAGNATAIAGTELASGSYTFEITGGTDLAGRTDVNYRVLRSDGTVALSAAGEDLSSGSFEITDGTGQIGITLTTTGGLTSGQQVGFEYIKRNFVKYELNDGSGVAQMVDQDGVANGSTGSYGYFSAAAAGTVNTGRGFTFDKDVIANINVGDSRSWDFLAAGPYSVDVSSASKGATYMTTVNSALDNVTKALSNLGSLMARLSFKEDSVATSQVNVEASYNRIMNANMAEEQMNASKYSILQQTGIAMLAQANQAPQSLLSLFR
jgi:flagellin